MLTRLKNIIMYNDEDENVLLYQYAYNEHTGEIVTPSAPADIGQGGYRPYNEAIDKGHLVCPECSGPHLVHRSARESSSNHYVRDHFATVPDEERKHSVKCSIGIRAAHMKNGKRVIDEKLGPYFYLNTGTPKPDYPHGGKPTKRAWIRDPDTAPDWVFRVQYAPQHFLKFLEIVSPELVHRKRIDPAKNITSFLKNIASIYKKPEYRKDSWVLVNQVATRLDKMIMREGPESTARDMSRDALNQLREKFNLPHYFRFPSNSRFDKFAMQLNEELAGTVHPVLLHFKVAAKPFQEGHSLQPKMVVNLGGYDLQGQHVDRLVHIKDRALFPKIVEDAEFFAIAHPYMKKSGRNLTQNFNIVRACDATELSLQGFKALLENPPSRKRKKTDPPEQISIPA